MEKRSLKSTVIAIKCLQTHTAGEVSHPVDEEVHPPEVLDDLVDRVEARLPLAHVDLVEPDLVLGREGLELVGEELVAALLVEVEDGAAGAVVEEALHDRGADAAGRARHDGDLS